MIPLRTFSIRVFGRLLVCVLALAIPILAPAQGRSKVVCYTAYDDEYFYLAAVVDKPNLKGNERAIFGNPLQDDALAVYLQTEPDTAGPKRTARSVEMAVSAAGGVQLYRGAAAKPLKEFSDFLADTSGRKIPFKYAVTLRGMLNAPGGADTGYTVEMAIPWVELGGAPTPGARMRFNVVAYSAAQGTSPVLSLASAIKTAADAQRPSAWGEIVFVEAPVKTVAAAPNARVSSRVFANKPLIDGSVAEGEWNNLTAFGFSESTAGGASATFVPSLAAARIRPKLDLRPARPPAPIPEIPAIALPARSPQPVPHLVFAFYHTDFQNDPRKALRLNAARSDNGATRLVDHPMDGDGPWMTYDRVDWHRYHMLEARRSGIDALAVVFRPDSAGGRGYSSRALQAMSSALRAMREARQDYPLVAPFVDTASLGSVDLRTDAGRSRLYAAIREFYLHIPQPFRMAVPLNEKNGGRLACVAVLSSAGPLVGADSAALAYCRSRFAADFGCDLLLLGGTDFPPGAKLDGCVDDLRGRGFRFYEGGWIKTASIGAGFEDLSRPGAPDAYRGRDESAAYRGDWKQALAKRPDWVFVDGWNDFRTGSEIAPTLEYGVEYEDQTRVFSRAFAGAGAVRPVFTTHTIPAHMAAGAACSIELRLTNGGMAVLAPETQALVYRWRQAGTPGAARSIPLPFPLIPGQAERVAGTVSAPSEPGEYLLELDVASLGRKGEIGAASGASMAVTVQVGAARPSATEVYADLPGALETGGQYPIRVTLRNDGPAAWKRGESRVTGRIIKLSPKADGSLSEEPVKAADSSAELTADVLPGESATVTVPLTLGEADGSPLTPMSAAEPWTYAIRWEAGGAVTRPIALAVVESDIGAVFTKDLTPVALPGDRRIPVKLGLRNAGPQTWRKEYTRIGYHWYYLDGTEAVWEDESTPIPQDLMPGSEIPEMLVWITAPPNEGSYYLVWDLKVGDTWSSTLTGSRTRETLVHSVEVVRGKTSFVDLTRAYNLDGISGDANRADGSFDGTGRTLPAELTPPYTVGGSAPSTVWLPSSATGSASPRRIAFKWGPKGDKEKNILQCAGQAVSVVNKGQKPEAIKFVHLLMAATKPDVSGSFTLQFDDGTQQLSSFPVSRWDAPPMRGEEVAFVARRTHVATGESLDKPVHLYHYVIRVGEAKKLATITLPNSPDIKIVAMTLER